ncbi:MAG TPA: 4-hydroxy-tetrahydrodipicolinate reductase, partial [Methanolinea sp.]|nr:4-hydroxy-tetrahydrodipicolinate reductase [Methanolinea sp.]
MTNVVVCGALGRMGTTIGRLVNEAPDLTLVGGVDVRAGDLFGTRVVEAARMDALLKELKPDVVIDFTVANAAVEN